MTDSIIDSKPVYKRPPITEAVIELKFVKPIEDTDLARISRRFDTDYPLNSIVKNFEIQIQIEEPSHTSRREIVGHRRSSRDLSEILLLWPTSFIVSQLAPYPGWGTFFDRFSRDWDNWNKASGQRKKIARVGVRFINRIDIPIIDAIVEESFYLDVYPKLPTSLGPVTAYAVQSQLPSDATGLNVIINSASVPSPLLGHGSIVVDIDVGKDINSTLKDEDVFDLLNEIRIKKNAVFEACVTDRARELFQA